MKESRRKVSLCFLDRWSHQTKSRMAGPEPSSNGDFTGSANIFQG